MAQTCSQIGADTPNNKPLIPPLEKSSKSGKSETPREKASPASSVSSNSMTDVAAVKSSFKPYESCNSSNNPSSARDKLDSPEERSNACSSSNNNGHSASSSQISNRVRTPVSKGPTPARCSSNQSANSPRASPNVGRKTPASLPSNTNPLVSTLNSGGTSLSEHITSKPTATSPTKSAAFMTSDPSLKDIPLGTFKPLSYLGGYPSTGHFPIDIMTGGLVTPQPHMKPGLNPYMSYARMKTSTGADTLVPVCRDPYCTGCQLSSHLLTSTAAGAAGTGSTTPTGGKTTPASPTTPCPGGCAQCDHATTKAGFLPPTSAAAAYAHAQLAALAAASQIPYMCSSLGSSEAAVAAAAAAATYGSNGTSGNAGKRFPGADDLIRSAHSSSADSLSLLSPPGLPATHPLFHRTYPTPPLSPLATARYHPYTKPPFFPPSLSAASSLGFPLHPHPGLPPYFSPYTLYGQRLGASSAMHP